MLKEVNCFKFPKMIIGSVLELNVNVVVQKETKQRVGRDVRECGQGNSLALDLT